LLPGTNAESPAFTPSPAPPEADTGKSKPVSHQGAHFFHVGAYGFPTKRRKQMAQESMGRASLRQGRGFIASANATSAASSCFAASSAFREVPKKKGVVSLKRGNSFLVQKKHSDYENPNACGRM